MAVFRIESVQINPNCTWQDIAGLNSWQALVGSQDWKHVNQIAQVNQSVFIEVEMIESTWERIKDNLAAWQEVRSKAPTWAGIKGW